MLQGFGPFEAVVGLMVIIEFFHVGFIIKKLHKGQQEANNILRQLVPGQLGSPK